MAGGAALRILIAGVRQLDSRGTAHPRLSADEARLLRLFGALQHGDTGEAVEILQAWLPSKPLRWLLRYARNFVGIMAIQKLILPDRKVEVRTHFALRASASAFQDRGAIYCIRSSKFGFPAPTAMHISCSILRKFLK